MLFEIILDIWTWNQNYSYG